MSFKNRHIEKLPKVVLGNEESLAVLNAQQLLAIIYYSGPRLIADHLQSPVCASIVIFLCSFLHFCFSDMYILVWTLIMNYKIGVPCDFNKRVKMVSVAERLESYLYQCFVLFEEAMLSLSPYFSSKIYF